MISVLASLFLLLLFCYSLYRFRLWRYGTILVCGYVASKLYLLAEYLKKGCDWLWQCCSSLLFMERAQPQSNTTQEKDLISWRSLGVLVRLLDGIPAAVILGTEYYLAGLKVPVWLSP